MEEEIEHIGLRLQKAREARGLSVLDVEFRTKIPHNVIRSLEQADFGSFASPLYAKSFLADYSRFLNVEADEWVSALEGDGFVPEESVTRIVKIPDDVGFVKASRGMPVRERSGIGAVLPYLAFASLSIGLVVGGVMVVKKFSTEKEDGTANTVESPPEPATAPEENTPVGTIADTKAEEAVKTVKVVDTVPPASVPKAIIVKPEEEMLDVE